MHACTQLTHSINLQLSKRALAALEMAKKEERRALRREEQLAKASIPSKHRRKGRKATPKRVPTVSFVEAALDDSVLE